MPVDGLLFGGIVGVVVAADVVAAQSLAEIQFGIVLIALAENHLCDFIFNGRDVPLRVAVHRLRCGEGETGELARFFQTAAFLPGVGNLDVFAVFRRSPGLGVASGNDRPVRSVRGITLVGSGCGSICVSAASHNGQRHHQTQNNSNKLFHNQNIPFFFPAFPPFYPVYSRAKENVAAVKKFLIAFPHNLRYHDI